MFPRVLVFGCDGYGCDEPSSHGSWMALGCDAMDHNEMQEAGQVLGRWGFALSLLGSDCLWDV